MNRRLAGIGIALLSFVLSAQVYGNGRPLRQERDALAAGADKLFAQWDKPNSPGAVLVVIKDGKVIYQRGYGMADLDVVGAGNLYTTVEDLFLWDQNFYNNKLHAADGHFISQALTPGALSGGGATNYAFGLYVNNYKGLKLVSHAGDFAGYRAEMLRFPGSGSPSFVWPT